MRVFTKKTLREFWETPEGSGAEQQLREWFRNVSSEDVVWSCFADVLAMYNSADVVGDCVVFNIGGNNYRLVVKVNYAHFGVHVIAVMTHKEYDKGKWKADCGC